MFVYKTGTRDSKPQKETMSSHTTQPHSVSVSKTVNTEANVRISDSQSSRTPTGHNDNRQLAQTETMISRKLTMDINQHKHTSSNVSNNSTASSGVQSEEALISPTEEHDNPIIDESTVPDLPPADLIDHLLQRPPIINSPSIEHSNQPVVMEVPKAESSVKDSGYSTRHTKLAQSTIFQQVRIIICILSIRALC